MTSSPYGPYGLGYTRATIDWPIRYKLVITSKSIKQSLFRL